MNPISFDVIRLMADAASNMKLATLSMATLRQARPRSEDEDTTPAANYATTMNSAVQSSQASQVAMNRAQFEIEAQESLRQQQLQQEAEAQARALDRARRRQALENARVESQLETQEDGGQESGEADHDRADDDAQPSSETFDAPRPPESAAKKGVLYTHLGEVKPPSSDKKLSVTA